MFPEVRSYYNIEERLKCIKTLVEKGANINAADKDGQTPIFKALFDAKVTQLLIEENADIHTRDKDNQTPLFRAVENAVTFHPLPTKEKALEVVQLLIEKNPKDEKGQTQLHIAAKTMKVNHLKCLISKGANVNEKDNDNNTPLHCVGLTESLQTSCPKYKLLEHSGKECCEILIRSGADVSVKNNSGQTPLDNYYVKKLKDDKPDLFKNIDG